jgi:uncharacterized protein
VSIPQFINTLEFVEQSLEIHDKIRASNLPGLKDVVFSDAGEIDYALSGRRAGRGKRILELSIRGMLPLTCQRCLGELNHALEVDRVFELVDDEAELPEDEFEDDEVDYLVIEPELDVLALVEEEVLLALPMALRHEQDCTGGRIETPGQKPNPFHVLEGLKSGIKKN